MFYFQHGIWNTYQNVLIEQVPAGAVPSGTMGPPGLAVLGTLESEPVKASDNC